MDVTLPNGVVINGVPEGTTKAQIQEMAIRNGMASMEDFGGASAPLDKPFYEMMPNEQAKPSEAFTNPNLDLSGQTVETQEGVTHYVDGYNADGTIDPKSPRWKGMTPNQIIEARNQDVRDGVIDKHIMREGPAYDQNAQVANVSRDKGIADRQVELEEKNPELSKQELFDKADTEQKIDGVKNVGQAALMLTPAGHGIKGMTAMGALAGAGDEALEVVADAAKGNRELLNSDNLIDVGEGALVGGAFGGVLGSVFKGAEKLVDMLKKSPTATDEVVELAKEYGIELTPGQKVDSRTIKHLEGLVEDGFGGRSLVNAKEEQIQAVEKLATEKSQKAKQDVVDTVFDADKEVQVLKKSVEDAAMPQADVDQAYSRMDDLYEEATRKVDENDILKNALPNKIEEEKTTLSKAYEKILKELDDDVIRTYGEKVETPIPRTSKLAKETVEEEKRLGALSKGVEKPVSGISKFAPKSFADLDLMKRNLNDKANTSFNRGEQGAAKKFTALSDAVKKDMDEFAHTVGGKTDEYHSLDKKWSELSELEGSSLVKALKKKEFGEDVWSALRSGPSKDSKVAKFVEVIGDNAPVKKAMTSKFMDDAVSAANKSGVFSVRDYSKFLKDNNSAMKHIDEVVYEKNKGLIKLMNVIADAEGSLAKSASQGPVVGLLSKFAPAALGGVLGGSTGGMEGAATGVAAGALGRTAMAKFGLPAMSRLLSEKPFKLTEYIRSKKATKLLIELAEAKGKKAAALSDKLMKGFIVFVEE